MYCLHAQADHKGVSTITWPFLAVPVTKVIVYWGPQCLETSIKPHLQDSMTTERVRGPKTLLGLSWDMVYGSNCVVRLVLKVGRTRLDLRTRRWRLEDRAR